MALFYALLRIHRKQAQKGTNFHKHISAELLWTAIPLVILVILILPAGLIVS